MGHSLVGVSFNEGAWKILRVEKDVLTIRERRSGEEWRAVFSRYAMLDGPLLEPIRFEMQKIGVGAGYYLLTPV